MESAAYKLGIEHVEDDLQATEADVIRLGNEILEIYEEYQSMDVPEHAPDRFHILAEENDRIRRQEIAAAVSRWEDELLDRAMCEARS